MVGSILVYVSDARADPQDLADWAAAAIGGRVTEWDRVGGGNSRTTFLATLTGAAGAVPIVVRAERGDGPFAETALSLAREAAVYRALEGSGVAAPSLLAVADDDAAIALSRVPGAEDWGDRVLEDLLAELAKLHRADTAPLLAAGFAPRALADLDLWKSVATQRVTVPSPFLEFAFDFLRRSFPGEPERLVFCHGDVGPGNFLHDGERLTALLDWEFSHLGDPIDDLAWITVRAAMFGVELPEFGDRVRHGYAAAAGVELDPARLAYWQAVVVLRNLVTCLASVSNPIRDRDRLIHYMLIPSLQVLMVRTMARIAGVEEEDPPPLQPLDAMPGIDVLGEIVAGLPLLVEEASDEYAVLRGKRMTLLGRQLVETLPLAGAIAAADAAEGPAATGDAARLAQLGRMAQRRLALLPRGRALAEQRLACF